MFPQSQQASSCLFTVDSEHTTLIPVEKESTVTLPLPHFTTRGYSFFMSPSVGSQTRAHANVRPAPSLSHNAHGYFLTCTDKKEVQIF